MVKVSATLADAVPKPKVQQKISGRYRAQDGSGAGLCYVDTLRYRVSKTFELY
jgi:hypothetical protein